MKCLKEILISDFIAIKFIVSDHLPFGYDTKDIPFEAKIAGVYLAWMDGKSIGKKFWNFDFSSKSFVSFRWFIQNILNHFWYDVSKKIIFQDLKTQLILSLKLLSNNLMIDNINYITPRAEVHDIDLLCALFGVDSVKNLDVAEILQHFYLLQDFLFSNERIAQWYYRYEVPFIFALAEAEIGGMCINNEMGTNWEFINNAMLNPEKKIRPKFNSLGTHTGRVTSNIVSLKKKNRKNIIPIPGHVFVCIDYAQADMRIIAHVSQDAYLMNVFLSENDPYTVIAEQMGVDRSNAKQIVLTLTYGGSVDVLAEQLNVNVQQAQAQYDFFYNLFPGIKKLLCSVPVDGILEYFISGRCKYLEKAHAHQIVNNIAQSAVADILKIAVLRYQYKKKQIRTLQSSYICNYIYDAVLISVERENASRCVEVAKMAFEGAANLSVPLKVNCKIMEEWE